MRIRQGCAAGAAAVAALATLSGCGDDGPMSGMGLPKAGDMAAIEQFVNENTGCYGLKVGSGGGTMDDEALDASWGIKERAVCEDQQDRDITLLAIGDMEKFQAATMKAEVEGDTKRFLVGQDFAVVPEGDTAARELHVAGLVLFTCEKGFEVPSGYQQEKPLVDGCTLTNFVPF
ncbi:MULTISPECIES: hypothetical protein [unclassified Streptomyces]|uniref:hypothetical protein n=1 Tax=unclassified Streptomyces TaxID=2593676 RepID=UPI0022B6B5BE|nr:MULTISPECIES: hypothetical protein [unclassified Streptomyces]MCZ7415003.1 hypothetical protein [Streptomyces sp. WMMC897]MCZ7431946.1 hypothetical protein [Streptomyces sp. WMMC1477]